MKDHLTIPMQTEHIITIQKSQFICRLYPVKTEDEAQEILTSVKKEHYKANHHCYAYILGEEKSFVKFSDDGEPSGTAGRPILSVLEHHDLTNVLAIVIRYFGGIKLGAGGLVRAYSQSVADCLPNASIIKKKVCDIVQFTCDYNFYGKLQIYLSQHNLSIADSEFSDEINIAVYSPKAFTSKLTADIFEESNGLCKGITKGQAYQDINQ